MSLVVVVGGLTVALGLQRAGVKVEGHEKYDHLARRASAFTMWSHAIERLTELGVPVPASEAVEFWKARES